MEGVAVVLVPFTEQGHLNQLLHFSLILSSTHNVPVHYACSPNHNRQARERIHGWHATAIQKIHFHDLPLPPFPSPPPDPNSTHEFPAHLIPSFEAAMRLESPLSSLLHSLSTTHRRLVVIHDPLMAFAGHLATSLPNADSFTFYCTPVFLSLSFLCNNDQNNLPIKPRSEVLDVILTDFEDTVPEELLAFLARHNFEVTMASDTIVNTCRPIEGEFIDLLGQLPRHSDKKLFAIGPVNPLATHQAPRHECSEWLDKQPSGSVLYVSFGSTTTISDEQIEQLAIGLQKSGQRFVWVLRDADRGDIYADRGESRQRKLPAEFEQEVDGVGLVLRGWAPQLEILAHPSTGGFMSHCGWNSCMESLTMGVPIVAWPMHSEQPRNAMLVTEYLKAGVLVREWGRRKEIVSAEVIEEAIKKVMVSDEGKEMRKRAKEVSEECRKAVSEGGSSQEDLKAFIDHITR